MAWSHRNSGQKRIALEFADGTNVVVYANGDYVQAVQAIAHDYPNQTILEMIIEVWDE